MPADSNAEIGEPVGALEARAREMGIADTALLTAHLQNWLALRGDQAFPQMSALFDKSDTFTQPWVVVVDTEAPQPQPIRLIGTALTQFFGFDSTGGDFLQSVAPEILDIFIEVHARLSREPYAKLHEAVCSTTTGREVVVYALALPYRRAGGVPCVIWLLNLGDTLQYGENGMQVRDVKKQAWINLAR